MASESAGARRETGPGRTALDEVPLEVARRVVETVAAKAVVAEATFLDERDEAGGAELGEVVLDRGLGQGQALGDLGQVPVAVAEQPKDAEPALVAQGPMEADDGGRRGEGIVGVERGV